MHFQKLEKLQDIAPAFSPPTPPEEQPRHDNILRVAATSDPGAVAGAIAKQVRQQGRAEVQAIGMAAVNQMMKAAAIARAYLAGEQLELVFYPSFKTITVKGKSYTAIRLSVWAFKYPSQV
jgi:stage V sporulation protein S